MHHENPQIVTSEGEIRLCFSEARERCEPSGARLVIDGYVASKSDVSKGTSRRRNEFQSWINVTCNFGHFWSNGVVCANRQKAVKLHFGKCTEKCGVES